MKNKKVIIVAIITFAILALVGMFFWYKTKKEREEELFDQQQIDILGSAQISSAFNEHLAGAAGAFASIFGGGAAD